MYPPKITERVRDRVGEGWKGVACLFVIFYHFVRFGFVVFSCPGIIM